MWATNFDKGAKTLNGERKMSLINSVEKMRRPHAKE